MDDLTIKKDVEAALQWDPSVNAAVVGVAVKNGIVTLDRPGLQLRGEICGGARSNPSSPRPRTS